MRIGKILREADDPLKHVLRKLEASNFLKALWLQCKKKRKKASLLLNVNLKGTGDFADEVFEFKAKNEVLAAIAPDIITPVDPKTCRCVTAEKIVEGDKLTVLGLPAPDKWRTKKGLELWRDVLQRSGIREAYVPIEKLMP